MKRLTAASAVLAFLVICTSGGVIAEDFTYDFFEGKQKLYTFKELQEKVTEIKAQDPLFARVHFRGQFCGQGQIFAPFYTCFSMPSYVNFSAWEFDAPLWKEAAFNDLFPLLYLPTNRSGMVKAFNSLKMFDRFEAVGEIRSDFSGKPWICITKLKRIDDKLNRNAIRHINRGYKAKDAHDHLGTAFHFSAAFGDELPRLDQGPGTHRAGPGFVHSRGLRERLQDAPPCGEIP